jgi:hypothetical protein
VFKNPEIKFADHQLTSFSGLIIYQPLFHASYPLIDTLSKAIPYVFIPERDAPFLPILPGDHLQIYYWSWLFKDNVLGASPLFFNPYEFNK